MRRDIKIILAAMLLLLNMQSKQAFAGAEGVGGGFSLGTAMELLKCSQYELRHNLERLPAEVFQRLPKPINKEEFLGVVLKASGTRFVKAVSPYTGISEFKYMDYGVNSKTGEKYILALAPFFQRYDAMSVADVRENIEIGCITDDDFEGPFVGINLYYPLGRLALEVQVRIFHETLHHFGYSEKEARFLTDLITKKYNQYKTTQEICTASDSPYKNMDDCSISLIGKKLTSVEVLENLMNPFYAGLLEVAGR